MTTDCMRSAPSPRLCAIAGNAVLTMVESRVCMKKLAPTSHSSGRSACRGSGLAVSVTGAFGVITELDQLLDQTVAVIALDLDDPVPDRAARAAQFLKPGTEHVELLGRQRQSGDDGNTFAAAPGGLTSDAHARLAGARAGHGSIGRQGLESRGGRE